MSRYFTAFNKLVNSYEETKEELAQVKRDLDKTKVRTQPYFVEQLRREDDGEHSA